MIAAAPSINGINGAGKSASVLLGCPQSEAFAGSADQQAVSRQAFAAAIFSDSTSLPSAPNTTSLPTT